jgi:hypothetical protein
LRAVVHKDGRIDVYFGAGGPDRGCRSGQRATPAAPAR